MKKIFLIVPVVLLMVGCTSIPNNQCSTFEKSEPLIIDLPQAKEQLLRERITKYYQYLQHGDWGSTWDFLSRRIKNHMATMPEAPKSDQGLKENYVNYMGQFTRELRTNQYYSHNKIIDIKYEGNMANVTIQGLHKEKEFSIQKPWIYEDSNWFIDDL